MQNKLPQFSVVQKALTRHSLFIRDFQVLMPNLLQMERLPQATVRRGRPLHWPPPSPPRLPNNGTAGEETCLQKKSEIAAAVCKKKVKKKGIEGFRVDLLS